MSALAGRTAVVTGSSRGIGAAIARRFAGEGARVAVNGRDVAALEAVCDDIRAAGGEAIAVPADVTRFDDIEHMRRVARAARVRTVRIFASCARARRRFDVATVT